MSDLRIEERCPCGNNISLSGFSHLVKDQITQWHYIHDKHANLIAKALAGPPVKRTPTNQFSLETSSVGDFADQKVEGSR